MRKLNARQKKALKELYQRTVDVSARSMSKFDYDRISNMNCFENFDTEVDRFLCDLHFEKLRSQPNPHFI